jgi:hypothetical protein
MALAFKIAEVALMLLMNAYFYISVYYGRRISIDEGALGKHLRAVRATVYATIALVVTVECIARMRHAHALPTFDILFNVHLGAAVMFCALLILIYVRFMGGARGIPHRNLVYRWMIPSNVIMSVTGLILVLVR